MRETGSTARRTRSDCVRFHLRLVGSLLFWRPVPPAVTMLKLGQVPAIPQYGYHWLVERLAERLQLSRFWRTKSSLPGRQLILLEYRTWWSLYTAMSYIICHAMKTSRFVFWTVTRRLMQVATIWLCRGWWSAGY